jgi:hypothetical protein
MFWKRGNLQENSANTDRLTGENSTDAENGRWFVVFESGVPKKFLAAVKMQKNFVVSHTNNITIY